MDFKNLTTTSKQKVAEDSLSHKGKTLLGKVTLVLSPDNESGHFLIRNLAAKGSDIVFVCLNGITQAALRLQAEVEALGQRCLVVVGDLTSWRFSHQLINQISEVFGHLDAFIDFSAQEEKDVSEHDSLFPNATMMTAALKYMTT